LNKLTRLLFVLLTVCGCATAYAAEPEQAETKPAAVAPVAAPGVPAPPVAPSTQALQAADAAATKPAAGEDKAAARVPSGYKAKKIDGETLYCRKSTPLGSRFPTEVCMTVAQYEESVRQRDGLRQELTGKQKSYSISQ
jgi:hypothetical protein